MSTTTPMPRYVGTKTLFAMPMTRGEYNAYRGWTIPADENPAEPGYLVEYEDGGKANDSRHAGYISWSPADVFERTYKPVPADFRDRVRLERAELAANFDKLSKFMQTAAYDKLDAEDNRLLAEQHAWMSGLLGILDRRIARFK